MDMVKTSTPMDIGKFKNFTGEVRLVISQDKNGEKQVVSDLSLGKKTIGIGSIFSSILSNEPQENLDFKSEFHQALLKAFGPEIADQAVKSAGLASSWQTDSSPLLARQVQVIVNNAIEINNPRVKKEFNDNAQWDEVSPELYNIFDSNIKSSLIKAEQCGTKLSLTPLILEEFASQAYKDFNRLMIKAISQPESVGNDAGEVQAVSNQIQKPVVNNNSTIVIQTPQLPTVPVRTEGLTQHKRSWGPQDTATPIRKESQLKESKVTESDLDTPTEYIRSKKSKSTATKLKDLTKNQEKVSPKKDEKTQNSEGILPTQNEKSVGEEQLYLSKDTSLFGKFKNSITKK
jgi:hypothetical protein